MVDFPLTKCRAMPVLFPEELVPIPGFNTEPNSDVPPPLVIASTLIAIAVLAILFRTIERSNQDS